MAFLSEGFDILSFKVMVPSKSVKKTILGGLIEPMTSNGY